MSQADNSTSLGSDQESDHEDFYTPGDDSLYELRVGIARKSIERCHNRLENQYKVWSTYNEAEQLEQRRLHYSQIKSMLNLQGSQIVSQRFTSCVNFNHDCSKLGIGSWDGNCYILNSNTLDIDRQFKLNDKISDLSWHPSQDLILTAGFDSKVSILNNNNDSDHHHHELNGHLNRVTSVKFHPFENIGFSSSWDETWRMWDLNTQSQIYYQEGHIGAVNTLDIHIDGSLLASSGADSVIKLWDLRTGQLVADLVKDGHVSAIHSLKFRINGWHLISGGADNGLKVWDIRKSQKLCDIPAHNGIVTNISISNDDLTLASSSYDGSLVLTECDSWKQVKKFDGVEKVMDVAISDDCNTFVTVGWGGDVKMYSMD